MGVFDWKHWIVILIVIVLVFGTKKMKGLGADVGESIKGFRKAMKDDEIDPVREPQTSVNALRDSEAHPPTEPK
ncbi:twin-arginine translocase TatA/TatE family subunit [Pseudomonas pergaminensis]